MNQARTTRSAVIRIGLRTQTGREKVISQTVPGRSAEAYEKILAIEPANAAAKADKLYPQFEASVRKGINQTKLKV